MGNACADFVKGTVPSTFARRIQEGIRLHRAIDAFSDDHTSVTDVAKNFPTEFSRYAGILLDVAFDHLLARSWHEFATISLEEFSAQVYRDLIATQPLGPPAFLPVVESMTTYDWLGSYRHPESVHRMLRALNSRLRRANPLAQAAPMIFEREALIEAAFRQFLPELVSFARSREPEAAPYWKERPLEHDL